MRILVDMDGVIADFEAAFLEKWLATHPDKQAVLIEERTTFQLTDQYPAEWKDLVSQIYSAPQFFRKLQPIPGSLAALAEMQKLGLEVFICTSPLKNYQNCVLEKYEWVAEHLGQEMTRNMILTRDKTLVRGDILIDDKPNIEGLEVPSWEHIIYDQPYNRVSDTSNRRRLNWTNWKEIVLAK